VHSEIETIHPFADGNGRTGRLWQTLILAKWNPLFAWIPMESVVYEKRPEYYDALQTAQNANGSGVFIEFALSALLETVESQVKMQADGRKMSGSGKRHEPNDSNHESNELNVVLLNLIAANSDITYAEMAEELKVSRATVQRHLQEMKESGLIRRIGGTRGHWEVK
jgi:Fic family protein